MVLTGGSTARFFILRNYAGAEERGYARRGEQDMQIGKPLRTIVVEPLELPVSQPTGEPEPDRAPAPEPEPEHVPVAQ